MKTLKMLVLVLALAFMAACPVLADDYAWQGKTIASGTSVAASADYSPIVMSTRGWTGYVFMTFSVTGTGTAKVEMYNSGDGSTFSEPTTAIDVFSGITSASGTVVTQVEVHASPWIKPVITETGGAAAVVPTLKIYWQQQ